MKEKYDLPITRDQDCTKCGTKICDKNKHLVKKRGKLLIMRTCKFCKQKTDRCSLSKYIDFDGLPTKCCSTCIKVKPKSEFGINKNKALTRYGKHPYQSQCKACEYIAQKKWVALNRDKARNATNKSYWKNIDENRKRGRSYYNKIKDVVNANKRAVCKIERELGTNDCKANRTPEEHSAFLKKSNVYTKKHDIIGRDTLSDRYVLRVIRQELKRINPDIITSDISDEMLQTKRKQLILKRKIKNHGKENSK